MDYNFDEFFNELIESGAVELSALDEDGNPLYSFTDKILDLHPSLADKINNAFHSDMMRLWQLGFLEMDITLVNPTVSLTDRAVQEEEVNQLPYDLKITLQTIKQAMRIEP
jgi:hypothetical protein